MSRNLIFVLMYHRHKLLDLRNLLHVLKITSKVALLILDVICGKFKVLVTVFV
jgi:hypothetical protein